MRDRSDDNVIVSRLDEILERVGRIEHRLEHQVTELAEDVDAIDRFLRPYGDGTRFPRRHRRG